MWPKTCLEERLDRELGRGTVMGVPSPGSSFAWIHELPTPSVQLPQS